MIRYMSHYTCSAVFELFHLSDLYFKKSTGLCDAIFAEGRVEEGLIHSGKVSSKKVFIPIAHSSSRWIRGRTLR